MTTRETTPLLTRTADMGVARTGADWTRMLAFGAVQWPWLLKSLYGGRKRDKAALLTKLGLPADALPNLGSWKADTGLLALVADAILTRKPQQVVELGAGASTLIVARALQLSGHGGRLTSYDQHGDFVEATRHWLGEHGLTADLRAAPLESRSGRWRDLWYDLTNVPENIDLLLIDGPPWTIDAEIRGHAQRLFDRVAPGGIIILDDAARPGERLVARQWARNWPQFEWRFVPSIKGVLIGERGR